MLVSLLLKLMFINSYRTPTTAVVNKGARFPIFDFHNNQVCIIFMVLLSTSSILNDHYTKHMFNVDTPCHMPVGQEVEDIDLPHCDIK